MRRSIKIKFGSILRRRFSLLASIMVLILIIVSFSRTVVKDRSIRGEIRDLETQQEKLEQEQKTARAFVDYLKSDAYIESEARKNFGFVKPGEQVIVIQGGETAATKQKQEISNPKKWFLYFFNPTHGQL